MGTATDSRTASAPAYRTTDEVNPDVVKVIHENEALRVLEVVSPPGGLEDWHGHPRYFVYVVQGGTLRITNDAGESEEVEVKTGGHRALDPVQRHKGENIGETTLRLILIEMKE